MKKYLIIFLALAVVFSLAACSNKDKEGAQSGVTSQEETVTLSPDDTTVPEKGSEKTTKKGDSGSDKGSGSDSGKGGSDSGDKSGDSGKGSGETTTKKGSQKTTEKGTADDTAPYETPIIPM